MCRKIIDAIRENYEGADSKAIIRAKRAGLYPLILIALAEYDLLAKILETLVPLKAQGKGKHNRIKSQISAAKGGGPSYE